MGAGLRVLHLVGIGARLGRLGVEHGQRRREQQQAAAHLKARQRDAEEFQDLQAQQGTGGDDDKGRKGRHPDGALPLCTAEALGVVDEKGHDGQRVDDGEQGDQGLEIHRPIVPAAARHHCSPIAFSASACGQLFWGPVSMETALLAIRVTQPFAGEAS